MVIPDSPACVIGLDIGGTKTAGAVILFPKGEVLDRRIIPTRPERDGETVLSETLSLAADLAAGAVSRGLRPAGIGAGLAELVNAAGKVTSSQTFRWKGLPVRERLASLLPALLESDVRAAALAEAHYGAGRDLRQFVYVSVGTGVSHTLVIDGRPFAGSRGNAILFASGAMSATCWGCGLRLDPVVEDLSCGPAMVRRYQHASGVSATRCQELIARAEAGDSHAIEALCAGGEALGVGVGWLANVLDPEAIVIGGGLGLCGGLYWRSFVESPRAHIWAEGTKRLPIVPAQLGTDAGVIGAAAAFLVAEQS